MATKPLTKHLHSAKGKRLGRGDWIAAARHALIAGGIAKVRVERLAKTMKTTTGSFYWHFRDRNELLVQLLADWEASNSAALSSAVAGAGEDAEAQMSALVDVWIDERGYSAAYDSAMRDWARIDKPVETVVRRVDEKRVAILQKIFAALGYARRQARIRARITYFHQVGYYAMRIIESRDTRRKLKPDYLDALLGKPPDVGRRR